MQIKSKTLMSWSLRKKKNAFFVKFILSERRFFIIWDLYQFIIMYWINFQNIYTFTYQKSLLYTLLRYVFKIVKNLDSILLLNAYLSTRFSVLWFSCDQKSHMVFSFGLVHSFRLSVTHCSFCENDLFVN